jgi:hypothetical protein
MTKRTVQKTTDSGHQQEKKSKGQVSSGVESIVVNNIEPNDVIVVAEDVEGVGAKTTTSPTSPISDDKITKVQDLLSVFLREKESEASCKKQVALAGRERDAASQVLRKSQTDLSIAVAKHDKLQGELRLKSMTVELVRSAWESAKADAGVKEVVDPNLSKVSQCAVTPERKK